MLGTAPNPNPGIEPRVEVCLRAPEGTKKFDIYQYETLSYTRSINGMGHHGWGVWSFTGERNKVFSSQWNLDDLISVSILPHGETTWINDFDGIFRLRRQYLESEKYMFEGQGTDLRALLRRRSIIPPTAEAYLSVDDHSTDILRSLVRTQCGPTAGARAIAYLDVEADTHDGDQLKQLFRWTRVADELEIISGLGMDFDIERVGGVYTFRVYYPYYGTERRKGYATNPVVFSVENGNLAELEYVRDRMEEITKVYVLGEGVGAKREIVLRTSILDAQNDSVWNLIEGTLEGSNTLTTGTLMAQGDAFLVENMEQTTLTVQALQTGLCMYRRDWDLGDYVTVIYDGSTYGMRIVEVNVTVSREEGFVVVPTFQLLWSW
jgi:hypothetical protein